MLISSAGPAGEVSTVAPSELPYIHLAESLTMSVCVCVCLCVCVCVCVCADIRELDVSSNLLLSSWQTVADVCSQLPQLRTLNVR